MIHEHQLSSDVDISSVERDQISVSSLDLIHAIMNASAFHTVQVRLEVLGGERHYHVFALHHLVVGDDAPASLLQRTFVQRSQALVHLRTYDA